MAEGVADFWLTVPFAQSIADPLTWTKSSDRPPRFNIVRFGFFCRDTGRLDPHVVGEVLQDLATAKGTTREYHEVRKANHTFLSTRATFREIVQRDEHLRAVAASVGSKNAGLHVGAHVKDMKVVTAGTRTEQAVTRTDELVISERVTIRPDSDVVAVALYQPRLYELYLQFIDQLDVSYERKGLFMRRRRTKWPEPNDGHGHWRHQHANVYNLPRPGLPWAKLSYWTQQRSFRIVERGEHANAVPRPFEVRVDPLTRPLDSAPADPSKDEIRSLYRISNDAFPYKRPPKAAKKSDHNVPGDDD